MFRPPRGPELGLIEEILGRGTGVLAVSRNEGVPESCVSKTGTRTKKVKLPVKLKKCLIAESPLKEQSECQKVELYSLVFNQ